MTSFKQFLEEQLLDENFAAQYEEVSAEMDLALALAMRREEIGLTQQDLATMTGIKQPMIARIEGGQTPKVSTLQKLAQALSVGVMFTGSGLMILPMDGDRRAKVIPSFRRRLGSYEMEVLEQVRLAQGAQRRQPCYPNLHLVRRNEMVDNNTSEDYGDARLLATA